MSGDIIWLSKEKDAINLPVGHRLIAIHRLIELNVKASYEYA